jgi:predicted Zn-dependent protease
MDKVAALTAILEQNPADAFARYGLAIELDRLGQSDQALAEFDKLLADHPTYVPGFHMAGQMLLRNGDAARAQQYLERGLAAARQAGNAHAESEISGLLDEISGR